MAINIEEFTEFFFKEIDIIHLNYSPKACRKCLPTFKKRHIKEQNFMLVCNYVVIKIDGDYAHLKRTDVDEDLKLVAMALLPPSIREGSIVHYELLEYTLIER